VFDICVRQWFPNLFSCYPNQGSKYVLLPQYFAVIAHDIEQHCGFGSALPSEESHIIPRR